MNISKKAILCALLLSLAGQSVHASDWSWLTGGIGGLFAPVLRHSGKILVGLGVVGGGYSLYLYLRGYLKRQQEQERADVEQRLEKAKKEKEEKITQLRGDLSAKLKALSEADIVSIEPLKREADTIDAQFKQLLQQSQQQRINKVYQERVDFFVSRVCGSLAIVENLVELESLLNGDVSRIQKIVKDNGVRARINLFIELALLRVVKKPDAIVIKGSSDEILVQIRDWCSQVHKGSEYHKALCLVEKVEQHDRKKFEELYIHFADGKLNQFTVLYDGWKQAKEKEFEKEKGIKGSLIKAFCPPIVGRLMTFGVSLPKELEEAHKIFGKLSSMRCIKKMIPNIVVQRADEIPGTQDGLYKEMESLWNDDYKKTFEMIKTLEGYSKKKAQFFYRQIFENREDRYLKLKNAISIIDSSSHSMDGAFEQEASENIFNNSERCYAELKGKVSSGKKSFLGVFLRN